MTWPTLDIATGPICPNCGCTDSKIQREAVGGQWFAAGRARCRSCGRQFHFVVAPAEKAPGPPLPPPAAPATPTPGLVNGERQEPLSQHEPHPRYRVFVCEDCGGRLHVKSTRGTVRLLKCKECGETYKLGGEEKVALKK
jgi:transcription elongation factor Elf1